MSVTMDYLNLGLGILIGILLGGVGIFAFFGRNSTGKTDVEVIRLQTQLEEQQKHAAQMQERMNETFAKISQETVDQNSKSFLQLAETKFAPFKELLSRTQASVQDLETKRIKAYTELESATKQIIDETSKLETALRRPDHRGRWGRLCRRRRRQTSPSPRGQ